MMGNVNPSHRGYFCEELTALRAAAEQTDCQWVKLFATDVTDPYSAALKDPCSGSGPQSHRGITPSENPAQDADRYARVTTRTPRSLDAKHTKTTEATQRQRCFIRARTMTPKHTLISPQKQHAGRSQSRPPGATMGGPVPNGPRSQARASSGPCPASLTALALEGDPRPSRTEAGKSLRLPDFQNLPKTNTLGPIQRFFQFPE